LSAARHRLVIAVAGDPRSTSSGQVDADADELKREIEAAEKESAAT
jgi:hypothetical protein